MKFSIVSSSVIRRPRDQLSSAPPRIAPNIPAAATLVNAPIFPIGFMVIASVKAVR
jgi:hypothetical protein